MGSSLSYLRQAMKRRKHNALVRSNRATQAKYFIPSLIGIHARFWDKRAGFLNCKASEFFVSGSFLSLLWQEQKGRCYYCDGELNYKKKGEITVDHVIPRIHKADNLVICCNRCNRIKSNSTREELEMIVRGIGKHIEAGKTKGSFEISKPRKQIEIDFSLLA